MIAELKYLFCILLLAEAHGQTLKSNPVCVGDAAVVPADSFYQPLRGVKPALRDYIDFSVTNPSGEAVSAVLFNAKGDSVLSKVFPKLQPNRYIVRFVDVRCPGVYFVRFTIGNQTSTRSVALQQSLPLRSNQAVNEGDESTAVEGAWEKSYSQLVFPAMSLPEEQPRPDTLFHRIVVHFSRHSYALEWITDGRTRGMHSEKYTGRFVINADTIRLLDAPMGKYYQFRLTSDSLILTLFQKRDGPRVAHLLRPDSPTLILEGVYRRSLDK